MVAGAFQTGVLSLSFEAPGVSHCQGSHPITALQESSPVLKLV